MYVLKNRDAHNAPKGMIGKRKVVGIGNNINLHTGSLFDIESLAIGKESAVGIIPGAHFQSECVCLVPLQKRPHSRACNFAR